MKRFTKILENIESQKYYEISADIKFSVKAENEGEAGYLADSILGSIKEQTDFRIQDIKEISKEEFQNETYGIGFESEEIKDSDEEKILKTWEAEFGNRTPNISEKLEFYHRMRTLGFDGELIIKSLDNKISNTWMKNQL